MSNEDYSAIINAHERELQDHGRRIDALEKDRGETAVSVGIIMTKLDALSESFSEKFGKLEGKVDAIEQKPAKRWDALTTAIISGIVGLILGMLFKGAI